MDDEAPDCADLRDALRERLGGDTKRTDYLVALSLTSTATDTRAALERLLALPDSELELAADRAHFALRRAAEIYRTLSS
jgi:hypothetical protein